MAYGIVVLFIVLMALSAISDILTMTISNKVPATLVGTFVVLAALVGISPQDFGLHFLTAFAVLAVTFGCFAAGWMGGGDAKLMAATALWFGPTADLFAYLINAALYGGVLTIALLVARAVPIPATGVVFVDRLLDRRTGIPYGVALGIAGIVVFSQSRWMDLLV